ncbi:alpha/beta fold hydrolase [Rhizobium sp. RAF56]|jgi:predicted alpha/beta hydrolase family esterase|uniref:alpha/beta fold hydrolase n=1 Tax=Rhizobium sp. RAF56 TaxID=3233062 RepID=UPI003F9A367B
MAKEVLFVQGAGEGAHDRWDSELVASLKRELGDGYVVRYPRMPSEDDASYAAWKAALVSEFNSLEEDAILVGHSLGGTILIHALAEQRQKPTFGGLFVIAAPFIGEGGWASDDIDGRNDVSAGFPPGVPVYFYHGADDDVVPTTHVHLYSKAIPHAVVRTFEHRDHQFNNDMSDVARDIRSVG